QAKAGLSRIHDFVIKLKLIGENDGEVSEKVKKFVDDCREEFEKTMDDDFDTSGALGALFDLVKNLNLMLENKLISKADAKYIREFLKKLDDVLAIIFYEEISLDEDEKYLIEQRELARKKKDFKTSDKIRDELLKKGIVLDDTPDGTVWKKL
ncbi:MAG: DALR domain-containing protein, partial [Patescibacteria group bacterium]